MKVLLLAILFALTNCEFRHTGKLAASPNVRKPTVAQRLPAAPVSPPAASDTAALLHNAVQDRLPGFVIDRFVVGNLNQDERSDFLVVCRSRQQVSHGSSDSVYEGRLVLVLNQGWPRVRVAAVSAQDIDCLGNSCRFNGVTIEKQSFSVATLEGDCEKTYTVHTYRYSPKQRNWLLYKVGERIYSMCSYNSGENEYHEETRRHFGRVVFGQ